MSELSSELPAAAPGGDADPSPDGHLDQDGHLDPDGRVDPDGRRNHLAGALVALVAGAALAVLAHGSANGLLAGIAVAQAVLIGSWVFGTALPGRIGALLIGGLAAAGADVAVVRWPHGQLGTLLAVLGLALPVMFVHQLTRGVVRTRVVESLSDIALLVVSVVALAALVQLRHETGGQSMAVAVIIAAGAALVAGHLVDLVWAAPRFDPEVSRGLLAVVVAVVVGAVVGYLRLHSTVEFTTGRAIFIGAAVAAIVSLFAVGAGFIEQSSSAPADGAARRLRPAYAVLVPLGLLAPVAYLLCLAIRG